MTKSVCLPREAKRECVFAAELLLWCVCFCFGILYAAKVRQAMLQTLSFCVRVLVPTLFPFMILSALLMQIFGSIKEKKPSRIARKNSSSSALKIIAFVVGALCGLPIGARLSIDLYNNKSISKEELKRFLPLANQCSLSFITVAIGEEMLDSRVSGALLYGVTIASAILVYFLFPSKNTAVDLCKAETEKSSARGFVYTVREASLSLLYTIGFILVFSFPIVAIQEFIPSDTLRVLLTAPLEFTTACRTAAATLSTDSPLLFPTLAFILSFGGICVGMQCELIIKEAGIGMRSYYIRKLLQGAIAFILSLFFTHFFQFFLR